MELLVRTVDKYSGKDTHFLAKTTKRGDVIVVAPDGWHWSKAELESDEWVIIKIDMTEIKANSFLGKEPGDAVANRLLQMRGKRIDLDALGYPANKRSTAILNLSEAATDAATLLTRPIVDPFTIG